MDLLGIRRGVIHGLKPLSMMQPRTVGFAFTVKQMARHHEAVGEALAKHAQVIDELSSPGDVLVVDVGGRSDICSGGALLSMRSQIRGLSGWVVNGCIRDAREIVDLGFSVHCTGTSPIKSSPALETVGINLPVEISGIQVKSGDLIVADDTGVVVVPAQRALEVLNKALQIQVTEQKIAELMRAGLSFCDARQQSERK